LAHDVLQLHDKVGLAWNQAQKRQISAPNKLYSLSVCSTYAGAFNASNRLVASKEAIHYV
jgi:hypothetical protein